MISGKHRVLILLAALASLDPVRAEDTASALIARLGKAPPVTEAFVEFRFSRFTRVPVRSAGTLAYLAPGHLRRIVAEPRAETTTIQDGQIRIERAGQKVRTVALSRVPELDALLGSVSGLLGGDAAALSAGFTIELEGGNGSFALALVPKPKAMARKLARIRVFGSRDRVSCLVFVEPDAEQNIVVLDPGRVPAPGQPVEAEGLLAACARG